MLNPNLDTNELATSYEIDNKYRVRNFMQNDIAERMHNACKNNVKYSTHYVIDNLYQSKTPEEMAQLNPQQANDINVKISSAASQGIGFLYQGYLESRISKDPAVPIDNELSFLHSVFKYMNSDEVIDNIKLITGNQDITGAELQYTRLTPGHFLTRHLDVVPSHDRRIAFVLGLTKGWHPDWGGLLQFYAKDGTPLDTWSPEFNVLTIFDVRHIHAVTYVTPYAAEPRLSLTGWFVAKG